MRLSFLFLGLSLAVGAAFAAEPAPEFITTPSGLKYAITRHGTGPRPHAGQVILVRYTGTLPDGTVFDSNRARSEPLAFTLGKRQVIKGWEEGFALLHIGDQATLLIPAALAYGDREVGPIPPGSTLRFDVELVGLKEHALADALRDAITAGGVAAGQKRYAELKAAGFDGFQVSEGQLNGLGYHYLQKHQIPEALAVFHWNVELFPTSGNVYDSLGEACIAADNRTLAIQNYAKSHELDATNKNATKLLAALKATPDAPGALAGMQARMQLEDEFDATDEAQSAGKPVNLPGLRTKLDAFLKTYPTSEEGAGLVRDYFYLVETAGLGQAVVEWRAFAASPNPKIRELAETKLKLADLMEHPLALTYTAVDGRPVNLAQWRGKVVLIDFWATWCGPCLEELPNVKLVYQRYHDQGFEIAGVSFDQAHDPAHPAKRQKSAAEFQAFTAAHDMPWPQYYDGLYWKNALGQRFAIQAIPAMFLLDKQGRLVSTNARGPALEREVTRLLREK